MSPYYKKIVHFELSSKKKVPTAVTCVLELSAHSSTNETFPDHWNVITFLPISQQLKNR